MVQSLWNTEMYQLAYPYCRVGFNPLHKVANSPKRDPKSALWEVNYNHHCWHEDPFTLYNVCAVQTLNPLTR